MTDQQTPTTAGSDRSRTAAIVLAAGKGTRFNSDLAKVLHRANGRTLLGHVLHAVAPLGLGQVVVVVGHQLGAVSEEVIDHADLLVGTNLNTALQDEQLGTGHAVAQALPVLDDGIERVVVLYGDTPRLTTATIEHLTDAGADATLLTHTDADPTGLGRIVRGADGQVERIVEHRDATADERAIREANGGLYAFDRAQLEDAIPRLSTDNDQGELYLTDVVELLVRDGRTVEGADVGSTDLAGVNDRVQLAEAEVVLRGRVVEQLQASGVTVVDPATTYVEATVSIGADTSLLPGCILAGGTTIGAGAEIGPYSQLTDATVEDGARVRQSVLEGASVGPGAQVGPFTYLRPGTRLERGAKAGGFVEMKKAHVGAGSKVPHLSYVGDTVIGQGVNVGAGCVTVNYDGAEKHVTTIGDGAFVGSGNMLVAPVTIGDGAYVATGSVITDDVPADALAIARGRQSNKAGWAADRRRRTTG